MSRLEISTRRAMHRYMSDLKKRRYWAVGRATAHPGDHPGVIVSAVADVDMDAVACTSITIYTQRDTITERHARLEPGTVPLTAAFYAYLEDPDATYDSLVAAVCDTIRRHCAKKDAAAEYTGQLIPLTQYAAMHGRDESVVRKRVNRGYFKSAVKDGRNWLIREDEPYPAPRWREK